LGAENEVEWPRDQEEYGDKTKMKVGKQKTVEMVL
jgi:hypothetical protein